ncbi:MAG: hypothetical protein MSS69_06980 [Spirochaetales bacterium]|nr:hypothetical protein [Spirochaetales bacterium]
MDMYIRDIVDSENAELIAKNEDLTNTVICAVNSLRSKGITNQEIAEYLHVPVSEIEAIPTSI